METNIEDPILSIIIPSFNEEEHCSHLLSQLVKLEIDKEIIVVDGGSTDRTLTILSEYGIKILQSSKGRGRQLSFGAKEAKGKYLLFLHADNYWKHPDHIDLQELIDEKTELASFPIEFDWDHWFLKLNAFFTRYAHPYFHFGDQGLWISKWLYNNSGGYQPEKDLLEDQDLYRRAYRICKGKKIKEKLIVSARSYRTFGVFNLQFFYYKLWLMNFLGFSKERIKKVYEGFYA